MSMQSMPATGVSTIAIGTSRFCQHARNQSFCTALGVSTGSAASSRYGGRDETSFRAVCEGSSKFIKDVLSPNIEILHKDSLTMLLPFKQDFIGNPLIPCLHGGIAASMLDHTACFCATAALEDQDLYLVTSGELPVTF